MAAAGDLAELPCGDKLPFNTRDEAVAAAVYARYRYGGAKPRPYHCRYCGRWHLSSADSQNEEP